LSKETSMFNGLVLRAKELNNNEEER